jgi:hypothetical protein
MNPQNIPNTGQRTVRAYMKVKSFVSPDNPTSQQLEVFDKEVNSFLETIDNAKRFLNGRNAYSIENKAYVVVWYLEAIPDQPVSTPFGKDVIEVKPDIKPEVKPNEQNTDSKEIKN